MYRALPRAEAAPCHRRLCLPLGSTTGMVARRVVLDAGMLATGGML
jgi:hypothetical protein